MAKRTFAPLLTSSRRYVSNVGGDATWPAVTGEVAELAWKLLEAPETITEDDRRALASVVFAYTHLVRLPPRLRDPICRDVRAGS